MWRVLRYFREELLIVLGTSSSEPVLPRVLMKLERLGCRRGVAGLRAQDSSVQAWPGRPWTLALLRPAPAVTTWTVSGTRPAQARVALVPEIRRDLADLELAELGPAGALVDVDCRAGARWA